MNEKFVRKTAAEIAAMSAEDQDKYLAAKDAHEKETRENEIKTALQPLIDGNKQSEETIKELAEEVKFIGEKIKSTFVGEGEDAVFKALEANREKIKEI